MPNGRLEMLEEKRGIPFGPDNFSGYICLRAEYTSLPWKVLFNIWFIGSDTFGWMATKSLVNSEGQVKQKRSL